MKLMTMRIVQKLGVIENETHHKELSTLAILFQK